jgi:outer membrane protein TolC
VLLAVCAGAGCRSPLAHRRAAESAADRNLARIDPALPTEAGSTALETPAETLRRRLLLGQDLPHAHPASLGTADLPAQPWWEPARHGVPSPPATPEAVPDPYPLSLDTAMRLAAGNSRAYRRARETLFRSALQLDLEQHDFRTTFAGLLSGEAERDASAGEAVASTGSTAEGTVGRCFRNGTEWSAGLAVDLVRLLTQDSASAFGVRADASITIPLLRGAGRLVTTEPLRRAEQDLYVAVCTFKRFKQTFAVEVAAAYLGVLSDARRVQHSAENYRRLVEAARRARRLADAGRLPEFQHDQAVQDQLRARTRWIAARQSQAARLDRFKVQLGLPTDSRITLDEGDLAALLNAPGLDGTPATGLETSEEEAVLTALERRVDLLAAEARVEDATRAVYTAADALRGEVTLFGSAATGEQRRGAAAATQEDARLRLDRAMLDSLLTIDLPFDRVAERTAYRASLLDLDEAVRTAQEREDTVKLEARGAVRELKSAFETVRIQADALQLARKRVQSTDLFLQAGRAAIRDVLEAQEALLGAENALTDSLVAYRTAQLALRRDLGTLTVGSDGMWIEPSPPKENP